jgi:N-acyl-D-amino-acid deacylase
MSASLLPGFAAATAPLLCCFAAPSLDEGARAQAALDRVAAAFDGRLGLYAKDLTTGEELSLRADEVFPQASSIKIPILVELHRQAKEGKLDLDDLRVIHDDEQIGGSGILGRLRSESSRFSLRDLATLMILESDNTATNVLLDRVGLESVNRTLEGWGFGKTRVRRRMMDAAAQARGEENVSTPREAARLLEGLFRDEFLPRSTSLDVLATLKRKKPGPIAAALPPGTVVANKTGSIPGVACDVGIVYRPRHPFALAVMTAGSASGRGEAAITEVARIVWDHLGAAAPETAFSGLGVRVPADLAVDGGESAEEGLAADLWIRGGTIVDGTGAPAASGDLAIRAGRIVAVGKVPANVRAARTIDATGCVVAPGFLDVLDHSGGDLPRDGQAESKVRMGCTTAITGEGGTPCPIDEMEEYFARLESTGIAINYGTFVGSGQVRRLVLGKANRAPSAAELAQMQGFVERAMRAGAFGLTSALIYPPASYATTEELVALASAAARHGGIYASHIRGEGDEVLDAVDEAVAIGERAGLPVEIFHLKCSGKANWKRMPEVIARIEAARGRGLDVTADQYPYTASSTSLTATVPDWAHEGGEEAFLRRLRDPETRAKVKAQMDAGASGDHSFTRALDTWEQVRISSLATAANRRFLGKTVAEAAAVLGKDPRDAVIDLLVEENLDVGALYFKMSEEDVRTAMAVPWIHVGSDAGAGPESPSGTGHPRRSGTFSRILARYVRDEKVLPLEEAIAKMTSRPARKLGIRDRGILARGLAADVAVFDLGKLEDRATFESPRLSPRGFRAVIVNGEVVVEDDRHTGALPGRALRGPGWDGAR